MPGVNDPSCHMLPQQPLHPCMFPSSSKRKTTHCLTNPYDFQIGCYPYVKNDPFIITDTPHVFFAGNQPKFETRVFHGSNDIQVRLLCIPSFAQSNSCIALNLSTRECYEISFQNETPQLIQ
ncbi:unnamed protein product [Rotaria socialis]|uniref:DNA polymerase alpha/delta/epsilon subunit B domain-containing protein n=1 Tax=Rotaria socialis TaxID=392032 RepID=A0A818VVY9_9BILA|nr:unnamed protein product [Rotaria socialis]